MNFLHAADTAGRARTRVNDVARDIETAAARIQEHPEHDERVDECVERLSTALPILEARLAELREAMTAREEARQSESLGGGV